MLERFRRYWSMAMTPAAKLFIALKVSPDVITWVGTVLTVAVAITCFSQGWLWQGALALGVFMLSDGIDGEMARPHRPHLHLGGLLDSSPRPGGRWRGLRRHHALLRRPGDSRVWWRSRWARL